MKTDIEKLRNEFSELLKNASGEQLLGLKTILSKNNKSIKTPEINADFFQLLKSISDEEKEKVHEVRSFMKTHVEPIANQCWLEGRFPKEIIPEMAKLNINGLTYKGYGCPNKSFLLEGILSMEIASVDTSMATFYGVQSGLAMGSIYICGSKEQKEQWLPKMMPMECIGAFGLTEPDVGSGIAGGMKTTAKKKGNTWILNGQKKWIGNATFSDITIIWAKDIDDNKVKGFIVKNDTPGFKTEKIEDKMALRIVQNALITMENCEVSEEDRLQNANSFKDTSKVLRMTRAGVAWQAVGCSKGAYQAALKYATERKQFGRKIAGFQLIQIMLVDMLSNLTAMQTMTHRLSQMQDSGILADEHASLAKVFCTMKARDIVSRARELMGGNGILLDYNVARFLADAEAIYSYEGTREINSLIVGRAITGQSAFV